MHHRRYLAPLMAVVLAVTFLVSTAAADVLSQDQRDFSFVNNSCCSVTAAYVSPASMTEWGSNVLSAPITPGEIRGIVFTSSNPGMCNYDLRAETGDGGYWELFGVDLCTTTTVVLDDREITAR
jgi:hypothetical protein